MTSIIFQNICIQTFKWHVRRRLIHRELSTLLPRCLVHKQPSRCMSRNKQFVEENVRHNGVRIRLSTHDKWSDQEFEKELSRLSSTWRNNGIRSVFLEIPIQLSEVISIAANHGFIYHHARGDRAVLSKWLCEDQENKIPLFSNHTVGVAGACFREETNELLVVRDKGKYSKWWKFPGGYSDMGEYIGETAVREVLEETGVQTEFKSILSFRQHHGVFYNQSDFYFICRLKPITFDMKPCPEEIEECSWKNINELLSIENSTPFVKMICRLVQHGHQAGFDNVDISEHDVENWARKGNMMKIFHRDHTLL